MHTGIIQMKGLNFNKKVVLGQKNQHELVIQDGSLNNSVDGFSETICNPPFPLPSSNVQTKKGKYSLSQTLLLPHGSVPAKEI